MAKKRKTNKKSDRQPLMMTFDPMTIEHLGVRMYSTLPPVLAELVANAYDADANKVNIHLKGDGENKEILISDDGEGMTYAEINKKFLRIGRNRRKEDGDGPTTKNRKVMGKKGLGKLAFFGIAHEITITTKRNGKKNTFILEWDRIKACKGKEYKPKIIAKNESCGAEKGTDILLSKMQRERDFAVDTLAKSLSKIFIFDDGFEVVIKHNDGEPMGIRNEMKYERLEKEVEWKVPEDIQLEFDYDKKSQVNGVLFTTVKPIPPKTNMRGVTLFSRRKLVNMPEYFSDSTSSHFFSYLTGWLNVDFIDDMTDDVISTNRQSLNWGHPEMVELRDYLRSLLNKLEQEWRIKRGEVRKKQIADKTGINISDWFDKMPDDVRTLAEPIIQALAKESELSGETTSDAVKKLHEIVPEYPRYHWRNLHPVVQNASRQYYIDRNYYTALYEAVKVYINAVKTKTGLTITDRDLLENVFSLRNPKLSVTAGFRKPSGGDFEEITKSNITEGHRGLVLGIWMACRCPIAHEVVKDLRESGLFTEKDCLDALSLLSHLFNRLDNAQPTSLVST